MGFNGKGVLLGLLMSSAVCCGHGHRDTQAIAPDSQALSGSHLTLGALKPAVTAATLARTIRPLESYTERLKRQQIRQYGYRHNRMSH